MSSKNWKLAVTLADHYKALGIEEVYLDHDANSYPWDLANRCEPGGSHRLEIATSIWFYADHPCGLSFRWSYDIEESDVNGTRSYKIKVGELTKIMAKITDQARVSMREYLSDCATKVRKQGEMYQKAATRQFDDADVLTLLSRK